MREPSSSIQLVFALQEERSNYSEHYGTPAFNSTETTRSSRLLKNKFTTLDDRDFEAYEFDGEHNFLNVPGVDLDKIADENLTQA